MKSSSDRCVYVATGDGYLSVYELTALEQPLRLRERVAAGAMPSFWAFTTSTRRAFAVNEDSDQLAAFAVAATTLAPEVLGRVACPGGPAYVALDRSERWVFAANYGAGSVNVFGVQADGSLAPSHQTLVTGQHAHCIIADASNRWVFVPNKGADTISQFSFDAVSGMLTPNAVPEVRSARGAGPRHLVFHPQAAVAYVINEDNSTLDTWAFDARVGRLELGQSLSTLPAGVTLPGNTGAHVQVHPSGRCVYVSNRGHDSIAVFGCEHTTGQLSLVSHHATLGRIPRNFAVDRAGELLAVANQGSGSVVVFGIDAASGKLHAPVLTDVGVAAFWVDFAAR